VHAEARAPREGRQATYRLRSGLRPICPSARERGCGVFCVEHTNDHPSIKLANDNGTPRATWQGLMQCGHIWSCPVCSSNLCAERATRITTAVAKLGGEWHMVTVTLRHRAGMRLKTLLTALRTAWRRCRQGGRVQRIWSERVTASVRATEVTFGENGWHPHVHVFLRTSEWSDDEKDALLVAWKRAIERELGPNCRPNDVHGIVWTRGHAAYLAKLGLEATGLGKKGRKGHATPWDIAGRAAEGDDRCKALWWEYVEATRGCRRIELDDRAQAAFDDAELEKECAARLDAVPREEPLVIEVQRDDVRALRMLERAIPGIFASVLHAAEERGRAGVLEWIAYARLRERLRGQGGAPSFAHWREHRASAA